MTPLMPAPPASSTPALPGSGAGAAQPPTAGESFAAAMEQGQAAQAGASADAEVETQPGAEDAPEAELPEGTGGDQPLLLQQQPLPWPPAGLAGLAFSPPGGGDAAGPLPAMANFARLASPGMDSGSAGTAPGLALAGGLPATGPEAALAGVAGDGAPPLPAFALPPLPSSSPVQEAAPMLETPLPAPGVRAQDFSERFGAQLQWMANEGIGHARIRVSPQELGPVEVMLRLDGERISAEFISAHAETRQALEHGLPRLRDLLGEHGFQLAHAGVGQDASGQQENSAAAAPGVARAHDDGEAASDGPGRLAVSSRLLDAYA